MAGPRDSQAPLFDGIVFCIIPSPELPKCEQDEITKILTRHGAQHVPYDGAADKIRNYTHVISPTADFPHYHAALDNFIHVVKPSWVAESVAAHRVNNPRSYSPDPHLIMSGVTIACAGLPAGDVEAIAGGVLAMGGTFSEPMTALVTHLVTRSLDDARCKVVLRKKLKCMILLPNWFDDCLRLGKRISERPYLLPDPAILKSPAAYRPQTNPDLAGAVTHSPTDMPNDTRKLTVFKDKRVMLAQDLGIGHGLRDILGGIIDKNGGKIVSNVDETDMYICFYRDGAEYIKASQVGKDVGNLSWLYHLITHDRWTSPLKRLLHYPVPRRGVPGFENAIISMSNYAGDERIYLQSLIKACGATYEKTLKNSCTHLVAAHQGGEKWLAAIDWNQDIVNHLWLEESYAKHQMQSISRPEYTYFPKATHLGEVLGQTHLDPHLLETKFYPREPGRVPLSTSRSHVANTSTPSELPSSRRVEDSVSTEKTEDKVPSFNDVMDWDPAPAADDASVLSDPPSEPADPESHSDAELPPKRKPEPAPAPAKKRGRLRKAEAKATPVPKATPTDKPTPAPARSSARRSSVLATPTFGWENEPPVRTSARSAKVKAEAKLAEAMEDVQAYEKERKRKSFIRPELEAEVPAAAKRKSSDAVASRGKRKSTEDVPLEEPAHKAKKSKTTGKRGIEQRMVLTGYERWANNPRLESGDTKKLRQLGIQLTEDCATATLLCAPKLLRTKKFICALAAAPTAVHTGFVDAALAADEPPDPADFPLEDDEGEKRLGLRLADSLARAKANKRALLKGWQVFCTEGVPGGVESMRAIVLANGGQLVVYKGRTAAEVKNRPKAGKETQGEEEQLILLSGDSKAERALWPKFKEMAQGVAMRPVVCRKEWLLDVALGQRVGWAEGWSWEGESQVSV
ncbi:hypothetical protein EJ06DRAFT_581646 [Trichodelitschia bisporula]|uniref:BRCT domain-containing protein n=1 Tax=Trichodelitschia bisporula TaxID=703511 RepID=A0A6G1I0M9_9PEZI|nr:hypothetical protein EJ06DRAFT_581646 [Trichodelitschia bisporula]